MIIIEPLGGLCNRLRACASACALAHALNRPLTIVWNIDGTLGCRFDDLFIVPDMVSRIIYKNKNKFFFKNVHKLIDTISVRSRFRLRQPDIDRLLAQKYNFRLLAQHDPVHIATCTAFYPAAVLLKSFVPLPQLQLIIDCYTKTLQNVIGVHIRRGDHAIAIKNSPTELFLAAMHREVEADPGVTFFLATDSLQEEAWLQAAFPNRIVTHEKQSFRRDDPAAIKDAVIDLFILSKCRKIIGSYWSSFTETAQALGSAEMCIIKKRQEHACC
jgi:hypothetical protein